MTMKSTNFKTKVGSTLLMLVCCCFMMHNVSAQAPAGGFTTNQTFTITTYLDANTPAQTQTFTVPENVYSVQIQCWGAGAAGAYMDAPGAFNTPVSGAGGGGGAYARLNSFAVTPGQRLTVVIGQGGDGGRNTRSAGGDSYVMDGQTVIVKAVGAPGLEPNRMTPGGQGGKHNDCIGDVTFSGGQGGNGFKAEWTCSGAGGGAAGNAANGSNGQNGARSSYGESYISLGGNAGATNPDSGKGGNGVVSHVGGRSGNSGNIYGGGGSGGSSSTVFDGAGGDGANGVVIISYNACAPAVAGTISLQNDGCSQRIVNVTSASGTAFVYSWERSDDGENNWTVVSTANTPNYTPTVSGYYRRGATACGATEYSNSIQVNLESTQVSVGYPSLSGSSDKSHEMCKKNNLNINLKTNDCDNTVNTIYWEYSLDGGTNWNALGTSNRTEPKNVAINALNSNCVIRYYHQANESCKIYSSDDFTVTVYPGALSQIEEPFTFDNSDVVIVLPYGESTTTPNIAEPDHNYNTEVVVTNDKNNASNEGELLGTIGVGTYTITWTVTDCSNDTRDYVQNVIVSYPDCGGDFKAVDADGNEYETVRIGAECWMKTNLKSTTYDDAIALEQCSDNAQIEGVTPYDNDESNVSTYGRLYSWFAAMGLPENAPNSPTFNEDDQMVGACPKGWHLPTLAQCKNLGEANLAPMGGYYDGSTSAFGGIDNTLTLWCIDSEKPSGHSNFIYTTVDNCDTPLGPVSTNPNSKMSIRCIHDAQIEAQPDAQ